MIEYTDTQISELPLEKAYKAFLINIINDSKEDKEIRNTIYHKVRFGIDLKFDINEYFAKIIYLDEQHGKFTHKARPKEINMTKMFTELEKREKIIKEALIESIKEKPLFDSIEVD